MLRSFVVAAAVVLLGVNVGLADEVKGKIKKVDAHTITVTAKDKDHVFVVTKDTKFLSPKGDALAHGLKNPHVKEGVAVVVKSEKKDGKEVASEIKLAPGK
jgi:hypothetical protein